MPDEHRKCYFLPPNTFKKKCVINYVGIRCPSRVYEIENKQIKSTILILANGKLQEDRL